MIPNSLSPKQVLSIQKSTKKINAWVGSVRSGKTFSSLIAFIIELSRLPPTSGCIVCRDTHAFRRNVLEQLVGLLGDDVLYQEGKCLLQLWGWKIHVIGAHDSRSEGKLRGPTFSIAYVDEATLIPEVAWVILKQRCAMNNAKIYLTTNPDSPFHWLKKDLDDNEDVALFNFRLDDNPRLTDDAKNYLKRQHKGLWYKRYILGEWVLAEGAVFDFFDEQLNTITHASTSASQFICGIDFGAENPTSFILVGYSPNATPKLWVEKEFYFDPKKLNRQKAPSEFAYDLLDFLTGYHNLTCYIDPSAEAFTQEIKRTLPHHHSVNRLVLKDANNDVINGIRSLQSFFMNGDLKIKKDCINLIREMQSYVWDSKKSEKGIDAPLKKFDHAIDALRYAVYSHFGKKSSLVEKTKEERQVEMAQKMQQQLNPWRGALSNPSYYPPKQQFITKR